VLFHELKTAARVLLRRPALGLRVILSIGLGLGAGAALFAIVDAALLRLLPVSGPDTLVALKTRWLEGGDLGDLSFPDYLEYASLEDTFAGVLAYLPSSFAMRARNVVDRVPGELVTENYFDLLGVKIQLGRDLKAQNSQTPESRFVAVISDRLWRLAFGMDRRVLGQTVVINGHHLTIIGVAPEGFAGLSLGERPSVWIPLASMDPVMPSWFREMAALHRSDSRFFRVVARLKPGVTLSVAKDRVSLRAAHLARVHAETGMETATTILPAHEARLQPRQREAVHFSLVALTMILVLLLSACCANVCALLLVRGHSRRDEMALRRFVGAGGHNLFLSVAAELIILLAAGLALGIVIAAVTISALQRLLLLSWPDGLIDLRTDWRVVAFASVLAIVLGIVSGIGLALVTASSGRTVPARRGTTMRSTFGSFVAATQVALCVLLVIIAGLFARALQRAYRVDLGYRTKNVLLASVDFNSLEGRYDQSSGLAFYREILERVRAIPGIRAAGWAADPPLTARRVVVQFLSEEQGPGKEPNWLMIDGNIISPGYLGALEIPVIHGRDFSHSDDHKSRNVVMITETLAQLYFPNVNPIGHRVRIRGAEGVSFPEIIGVVADVKQTTPWDEHSPLLYLPLLQRYFPEMTLHLKFVGEQRPVVDAIRSQFQGLDPELPVFNVKLLEEQLALSLADQRLGAIVSAVSAALSIALATIGIYALTSYFVAMLAQELAIRTALGAPPRSIVTFVLRKTMIPTLTGILIGVAASIFVTNLLEAIVIGLSGTDVFVFVATTVLIVLASLLGGCPAAREALSTSAHSRLGKQ